MYKATCAAVLVLALSAAHWLPASAQYPPPNGSCPLYSTAATAIAGDRLTLSTTLLDVAGLPVPFVNVLFRVDSQPGTDAGVGSLDQDFVFIKTDAQGRASTGAYVGTTPGTVIFGLDCGATGASRASISVSANPAVTPSPTAVPTSTPTATPSTPTQTPVTAPNDNFANAFSFSSFPFSDRVDDRAATSETGEPTCVGHSVWYRFTPSANAVVRIDTGGSDFDTALGVFTGSAITGLTGLGCDNNGLDARLSKLTLQVTGGTTYYIQAGGFGASTGSTLKVNLGSATLPPDAFVVALECGNGLGVSCAVPLPASGAVDVAVKIVNQSGSPHQIAAFNFDIYDADPTRLAVSGTPPNRDTTALPSTAWSCGSPPAVSDTGLFDKPDSFLGCFVQSGTGDLLPSGSATTIGVVHYSKAATSPGTVHLTLFSVSAADENAASIASCDVLNFNASPPLAPDVIGPCVDVDIVFVAAPAVPLGQASTAAASYCPDLNADHKINSTDQLILAQHFSNVGGPKYVLDFDVNKDGNINSTDMLIQAKVYGPC